MPEPEATPVGEDTTGPAGDQTPLTHPEAPAPLPSRFDGNAETDRAILLELYNSTNGDNWNNNENWLSDQPLQRWYGVKTLANGQVEKLDLAGNGLSGSLPETLWFLDELTTLYLEDNNLSGHIPGLDHPSDPTYVDGVKLTRIDLTANQFTGCIPLFITEWVPQGKGNYGTNQPCPNPDRAALQAIYDALGGPEWTRQGNWATDAPLSEWGGLIVRPDGRVAELHISPNNVKGQLPPEIGQLEMLEYLSIDNHPGIQAGLIAYKVGQARKETGTMEALLDEVEGATRLTGELPPEIGALKNLKSLSISFTPLTGPLPQAIAELQNLESLRLVYNEFNGPIPPEYTTMKNLSRLDLSGNRLTGPIPPEMEKMENLALLYLGYNLLEGPIPTELGGLTNLSALVLRINQLTGEIPPSLAELESLRHLDLSYNQLTGSISPQLGNLTGLGSLRLSGNMLSGALPRQLGKLEALDRLEVDGNQLTGNIPEEIFNETGQTRYRLGHNQFTGCIPEWAEAHIIDSGVLNLQRC